MTSEEFASSVQRGSGRAALCLLNNDPAPYLPALIDACLKDYRWTVWTEASRHYYLLLLATLIGAEAQIESAILDALPTTERGWDSLQQWRILRDLAERGFPRSRSAVLSYALRDDRGVSKVASWGAKGLQWLLDVRPELFEVWDCKVEGWIEAAEEVSGAPRVESVLSPDLRARREAFRTQEHPPYVRETKTYSFENLLAHLCEGNRFQRRSRIRSFGTLAPLEERRRLAEWMLELRHPRLLKLLSHAFHRNPWPLDISLALDRVEDARTGETWRRTLDQVIDPRLRVRAWELLAQDPPVWDALDWLEINFQPGDEDPLWNLLQKADREEDWRRHNISLSIKAIMHRVGVQNLVPHLEWLLENTPCSSCRVDVSEALAKAELLSDRYRREAAFDSESKIRDLADDRPQPLLSPDRFGRAVRLGLGRAELTLRERVLPQYIPHLLWIAHNREPAVKKENVPRAAYLAHLAELAYAGEKMVNSLLAVLDLPNEDASLHSWRIALLTEFASRGYPRAQSALPRWPLEEAESQSTDEFPPATEAMELWHRFEAQPDQTFRYREAERFGLEASDAERRLWAERMLQEEDDDTVWAMGHAFRSKPWPLEAEAVIARIDAPTRNCIIWRLMLKEMANPEIRAFALACLNSDPPDRDAVGFLRHTYQPGDEKAVEGALKRVDLKKDRALRRTARDVVMIARVNGIEHFLPSLEWVVENSPSSRLRTHALQHLLKANALSDYHRREAAYDAEPATRALVNA